MLSQKYHLIIGNGTTIGIKQEVYPIYYYQNSQINKNN
jgi:hypothetical protein